MSIGRPTSGSARRIRPISRRRLQPLSRRTFADDQEIDVRVFSGSPASLRAEEDDLTGLDQIDDAVRKT